MRGGRADCARPVRTGRRADSLVAGAQGDVGPPAAEDTRPPYGFASVRRQTWFPYGIQIALNGREWLRRALDQERIAYVLHGNKFLHIADYDRAQQLLARQNDARWASLLNGFLPEVFPTMAQTLGPLGYYWTLWQSEWATDYIFDRPTDLAPLTDSLMRQARLAGCCERVLRYFGRPVDAEGQPHPAAAPEVLSRAGRWHEGVRVRHGVDGNSVKVYSEHHVLRAEMTMNNPAMFRVWRPVQSKPGGSKKRLALRKGIADIPLRAQVADEVNRRFTAQLATVRNDTPVRELLAEVTRPFVRGGAARARPGPHRQGPRSAPGAHRPVLRPLRGYQPPTPAVARPVPVGRRPDAVATLRVHHPAPHAPAPARHCAQAAQSVQPPAHR